MTVQPLWDLYAGHFSRPDASPDGPPADAIAEAVARVGHEALEVDPARLRFARPGMGVTLNGIGQGYITDRVVELLRRRRRGARAGRHGQDPRDRRTSRRAVPGRSAWRIRALPAPSPSAFRSLTERSRPRAATAPCSTRPAASTISSSRGAAAPAGAGFRFRSRARARRRRTHCPTPLRSCRKRRLRRSCVRWCVERAFCPPGWNANGAASLATC